MQEDWDVLSTFFPADWRALAVESGALKGLRKTSRRTAAPGAADAHLVRALVAGDDLSDVALMKRLRKSGIGCTRCAWRVRGKRRGVRRRAASRWRGGRDAGEGGRGGRARSGGCTTACGCRRWCATTAASRRSPARGRGRRSRSSRCAGGTSCSATGATRRRAGSPTWRRPGAGSRCGSTPVPGLRGRGRGEVRPARCGVGAGPGGHGPGVAVATAATPVCGRVCALRKSDTAIRLAQKKLRPRLCAEPRPRWSSPST